MPALNGRGPQGLGPRTGRGMGNCFPGYTSRYGYGRGLGFGRGYGFRRYYSEESQPAKEEEKKILNEELNLLKKDTEGIKNRLEELNKNN